MHSAAAAWVASRAVHFRVSNARRSVRKHRPYITTRRLPCLLFRPTLNLSRAPLVRECFSRISRFSLSKRGDCRHRRSCRGLLHKAEIIALLCKNYWVERAACDISARNTRRRVFSSTPRVFCLAGRSIVSRGYFPRRTR